MTATPRDKLSALIEGTFLDPEERDELRAALDALSADTAPGEGADVETCPTCWQPVPRPQRGDHDYGIPLRAALAAPSRETKVPGPYRMRQSPAQVEGGDDPVIGPFETVRCPVCHQPFSPKGLAIHKGMTGHAK